MMKKIFTLLAIAIGLASCNSGPSLPAGDVTTEQFASLMAELDNEIILDVRTTDETQSGIIPGARTLDFFNDNFKTELEKLDKDAPIMVYCAAGGRSAQTVTQMNEMGFTNVYNLLDGFGGWKAGNNPVEKK